MCQLDMVKTNPPGSNKIRNTDSRRDLTENAAKFVKIHRLRQMEIESSFSAALDIITLSERLEGPPGSSIELSVERNGETHAHKLQRKWLLTP